MGDLTKQAQLLKKCVKLAVYIRSGREFVSILTMQPNNVLEKGAFFGRVSEQGKQYMIRRMIVKIRSNLTAFHIEMEEQSFVIVDLNAVMTYVSRKQKEIAAGQLAGTVADTAKATYVAINDSFGRAIDRFFGANRTGISVSYDFAEHPCL